MSNSCNIKTLALSVALIQMSNCHPARAADKEGPVYNRSQQMVKEPSIANQIKSRGTTDLRGFVDNIEKLTTKNGDFRRVIYTGKNTQLVLMALKPGESIGLEVHADTDQFFRVDGGAGEVVINSVRTPIADGSAVVVPAGAKHDIINTGNIPLTLYTLYSPPHHRDATVHRTKAEAEKDTEHFDGKTTE